MTEKRRALNGSTKQQTMRTAVVPLSPCQVFRQIGPDESVVRLAIPRKGMKQLAATLDNLLKSDVLAEYFGLDCHVQERELDGDLFASMQVVEDVAQVYVARLLYFEAFFSSDHVCTYEEMDAAWDASADSVKLDFLTRATARIQEHIRTAAEKRAAEAKARAEQAKPG